MAGNAATTFATGGDDRQLMLKGVAEVSEDLFLIFFLARFVPRDALMWANRHPANSKRYPIWSTIRGTGSQCRAHGFVPHSANWFYRENCCTPSALSQFTSPPLRCPLRP